MRKLIAVYKDLNRVLKIYESPNKLRGEEYSSLNGEMTSCADFFERDKDKDEFRVLEYYGFKIGRCFKVPFERTKGGKIVFYPVDKSHRVIASNMNYDYDEWKRDRIADGADEDELSEERYYEDFCIWLDDERANLNKEVNGCIIAFANLGLWNGRQAGYKVFGSNIKNILYSSCDYYDFYCDQHNVRGKFIHHDGTNYILYRVAENREQAERIAQRIYNGEMDEEQFRKATRSLRPYVAKVYGW